MWDVLLSDCTRTIYLHHFQLEKQINICDYNIILLMCNGSYICILNIIIIFYYYIMQSIVYAYIRCISFIDINKLNMLNIFIYCKILNIIYKY